MATSPSGSFAASGGRDASPPTEEQHGCARTAGALLKLATSNDDDDDDDDDDNSNDDGDGEDGADNGDDGDDGDDGD